MIAIIASQVMSVRKNHLNFKDVPDKREAISQMAFFRQRFPSKCRPMTLVS